MADVSKRIAGNLFGWISSVASDICSNVARKGSAVKPSKMIGKSKGQFFLLGAFLVCTMFFLAYPRQSTISSESSQDLEMLSLNLQKEMPNAYNLGIKAGDGLGTVKNFTWFADNVLKGHRIGFASIVVMGGNSSPSDYNLTIFNYNGSQSYISITIGSATAGMLIQSNSSNNTVFPAVGEIFNISISHGGEQKNMTWVLGKNSIYGTLRLVRSESMVMEDFEG
jgi:hypothetical protein